MEDIAGKENQKLLLIGWDAADWKIINPLIDEGKMPNLEKLINQGVMGNLATLYPSISPMLWTSIATGKRPFKHGIHGFTEPDPHSNGIRPISSLSRRTKALWNILCQNNKRCNVIGWWPSHPAEPINGVMVSNLYQRATTPYGTPWPMAPGTVHPEKFFRSLKEMRTHPQELETGLIMNFIPNLARVDQDKDRRIENLAKIIADCTTVCNAATAIMLHEPWDFTAVYFDAVDHFCHGFMRYHPPRLEWVDEEEFEIYNRVVEGAYIYHDILLGRLLEAAGEESTVILVSDHGFHSDHMRSRVLPHEPAGPTFEHRHYGIVVMKGAGIKKDELIFGSTLLDICPTVLTLYGLPVGEDMDGKPLANAFDAPPVIESLPSWDLIPGNHGSHPKDIRIDPIEAKEAIKQLVDLGYIEPPDENIEKTTANTIRELQFNLACSYMDANRHLDAANILGDLFSTYPDEYRFGIQLSTCRQAMGDIKGARIVMDALLERRKMNAENARTRMREIYESHKDEKPMVLGEGADERLRNLNAQARLIPYDMEFLMGSLLFAEGDEERALVHLKNAEKENSTKPALFVKIGDVLLRMKEFKRARKNYRRALEIDPDNAAAHLGLCRCFLPMRNFLEAADSALKAVGLLYHNPRGHFLLGRALYSMGLSKKAVEAFNVAVSQNPNFPQAHLMLSYIYKNLLKESAKAAEHRELARDAQARIKSIRQGKASPEAQAHAPRFDEPGDIRVQEEEKAEALPGFAKPDLSRTLLIVSGLPRSGTSMMMQMLDAGGIPLLTDGARKPDEDNPRGYFEFNKVLRMGADQSWVSDAKGKAVKIVAQLLKTLAPIEDLKYRVIFMERRLDEVVRSQIRMLTRMGKKGADLTENELKQVFWGQLIQIKQELSTRGIPVLYVDYNKALKEPCETAGKINHFLGCKTDEKKMAAVIDPTLYRQRISY